MTLSRQIVLLLLCLCGVMRVYAQQPADPALNDTALAEQVRYPEWFELSFLNLPDDLQQALEQGKRGLLVYFGQHDCPYCQALIEKNLTLPDIEHYIRRYFNVVPVNIHGDEPVTDMAGREISERQLAQQLGVDFTPTLLYYDAEGKEAMRLNGYHPPYQFRAALEYMADAHYREESFRDYLERADPSLSFEAGGLNESTLFSPPPYALDRSRVAARQPLVVFFEQGDCHACDILHSAPLGSSEIQQQLTQFESVQLDIWSDTPVITPSGERTTSREWAKELGLFYTPSLLFFDVHGRELLRVDSVIGFYRLRRVLDYILSGAYNKGVPLLQYRRPDAGGDDGQ